MRRAAVVVAVLVLAGCGGGSSSPPKQLLHPEQLTAHAPPSFDVAFATTAGDFVVRVHRAWAPHGADRFYNLVQSHFYDGAKIFRVVPGFVVQFGISPFPEVSQAWQDSTIPDDPVRAHNTRGAVTFAAAGPDTRTTQVFVNLGDNTSLDSQGFAPFGRVAKGMKAVDSLYSGYGDDPTTHQGEMAAGGNGYLEKSYPKLDEISSATVAG